MFCFYNCIGCMSDFSYADKKMVHSNFTVNHKSIRKMKLIQLSDRLPVGCARRQALDFHRIPEVRLPPVHFLLF